MPNDPNSKFEKARAARNAGAVVEEQIDWGTSSQRFQQSHAKERQRIRDAQAKAQQDAEQKQKAATEAQNSTGGVLLDAKTIQAKQAYETAKRATKPTANTALPTFDVIYTMTEKYLAGTAAGRTIYPSADNMESFCNCLVEFLILGWPLTFPTMGAVHSFLLKNDRGKLYLELPPNTRVDKNGNTVRSRGDATRPAAEIYPRYISPDNEVQQRFAQLLADQERWLRDVAATRRALDSGKLSFDELQRQVRQSFKKPPAGQPGHGGIL